MDPVDEYAELKAQIRRLQDRADVLRDGFLRPAARLRSNQYEVVVKHQRRRLFQKDRLPPDILNDPRYWEESLSELVTLRSLAEVGQVARRVRSAPDDFALTEPFGRG